MVFVIAFAISWLVSGMSTAKPEVMFNQASEPFMILHFPDDSDDGMLTVYIQEVEQIVDTLVPGMYAIGGLRIGALDVFQGDDSWRTDVDLVIVFNRRDLTGDGITDISDLVTLIDYMFRGAR